MILSPRYDGPTILTTSDGPRSQELPCTRQRRRMEAALATLTADQWALPSRCDGWSVRDVVVHLTGVNAFWQLSVLQGVAGTPTRFLAAFDPATTPDQMVAGVPPADPADVLQQFIASNDGFLGAIASLEDDQWTAMAESPIGHVSIGLMVQHALWDSWIHERDIVLPLGLAQAQEADEVGACLVYAAAVSPALGIGFGLSNPGKLAVRSTAPGKEFTVEVADSVQISPGITADVPRLEGDAAELADALSMRAPMPADAPPEWVSLRDGVARAFDSVG